MSTAPAMDWSIKAFGELDALLLHDILRLRVDVFVVEQQCPYPELDGRDASAMHVVGRHADGAVVAYARILPPGADGLPHVGRVVVAPGLRGAGLGRQLMQRVEQALVRQYGDARSALAAQAHLVPFYRSLGYSPQGAEYLLDGIPHVDMVHG